MTSPVPTGLAYGVRDAKLTQYTDALGMVLGSTSVDVPYMQHLNFTEAEEFADIKSRSAEFGTVLVPRMDEVRIEL